MKIFITSGGTRVPIDPVRHLEIFDMGEACIMNMSSGNFGSKIAEAALQEDHEVFYFVAEKGQTPFTINSNILNKENSEEFLQYCKNKFIFKDMALNLKRYTERTYRDYEAYRRQLPILLDEFKPDAIVLAAAVSDYVAVPHTEKIRSAEHLSIELTNAEKIIGNVKKWQPNALLVGFKLLVNSTETELIAAAEASIIKNNCDLIVANDLTTLKAGNHEVLLVEPDASRQIVVNKYQQNGALEIVKRIHSLCESQQALRTRIVAKLSNGNTLDEIREKLGNENIVPYGTFD